MRTFNIDPLNGVEVVCESKNTRSGFKHEATLLVNGYEEETVKICYLNRTWEAYEYDSVMEKLATKTKRPEISEFVKNRGKSKEENDGFGLIFQIAKMGDVLCKDAKEKNDWKKRMFSAGLGNKGLMFPKDWDTLSEEEKQKRLDGALETLK